MPIQSGSNMAQMRKLWTRGLVFNTFLGIGLVAISYFFSMDFISSDLVLQSGIMRGSLYIVNFRHTSDPKSLSLESEMRRYMNTLIDSGEVRIGLNIRRTPESPMQYYWWVHYNRTPLTIYIPTWLICAIISGIYWIWKFSTRLPKKPGLCLYCSYDLTGNASGVCPECGSPMPLDTSAIA